ncbi:MAG: SMI1/KNR4 family protein [Planctomycetes bacterium]|nr:SMI1/KNR4 family protein [Planctomycetota bacterium]
MEVTFKYLEYLPKRSVSEDDIAAEEQALEIRLPAEVRAFILAHDSATPCPAWFSVPTPAGLEWHGPILYFLSTEGPHERGQVRAVNFWATAWRFRQYQKMPPHYLPMAQIGSITKENYLLVSVAAADSGTVYLWREYNKRFRTEQLKRAAGSFVELLAGLAAPPREIVEEDERITRANHEGRFRRPPPDFYAGPEARRWLGRNRNPAPLGANHFRSAEKARIFVKELYAAGATRVLVPEDHIQDDDDDGPYADALVVFLPSVADARAAVCRRCQDELDEPEVLDVTDPNPVFLWWD